MKNRIAFIVTAVIVASVGIGLILFALYAGNPEPNTADTKIDYGTSELYSKEDMDKCIPQIYDKINEFESVKELYSITYAGDERCRQETEEAGKDIIVFLSDFSTKRNAGGAWNDNDDYTDWGWIFEKGDNGEWNLRGWGYA
jgi:hypothetical protein